jgi:hypothetical protein
LHRLAPRRYGCWGRWGRPAGCCVTALTLAFWGGLPPPPCFWPPSFFLSSLLPPLLPAETITMWLASVATTLYRPWM